MPAPQALLSKLAANSAIYVQDSYTNIDEPFSFFCSCGMLVSHKTWRNLRREDYVPRCFRCSSTHRKTVAASKLASVSIPQILEKCSSYGAIPDLSTYKNNATPFQITCACGTVFQTTWGNLRKENCLPRCRLCYSAQHSGPNHPNWKHEKLDSDRTERHYDPRYMPWVNSVLQAHKYTCVISGQHGGKLAPHHLYNWADYPDLRFEVSNGVVLTRELHMEFHRLYGRGNNTLEQFQEFFLFKTGRVFMPTIEL